jgi:hypothetical protein
MVRATKLGFKLISSKKEDPILQSSFTQLLVKSRFNTQSECLDP